MTLRVQIIHNELTAAISKDGDKDDKEAQSMISISRWIPHADDEISVTASGEEHPADGHHDHQVHVILEAEPHPGDEEHHDHCNFEFDPMAGTHRMNAIAEKALKGYVSPEYPHDDPRAKPGGGKAMEKSDSPQGSGKSIEILELMPRGTGGVSPRGAALEEENQMEVATS